MTLSLDRQQTTLYFLKTVTMLNLFSVQTLVVCKLTIFSLPKSKRLHVVNFELGQHTFRKGATCQKKNLVEQKATK